jgi:hypothetical protein
VVQSLAAEDYGLPLPAEATGALSDD